MTLKPYAPLDEWWETNKHSNEERTGASSCLAYFEKYVGTVCTKCDMELVHRDTNNGAEVGLCERCFGEQFED